MGLCVFAPPLPLHFGPMPPIVPANALPVIGAVTGTAAGAGVGVGISSNTSINSNLARSGKEDAALRAWRATQRTHRLFDALLKSRLAALAQEIGIRPSELSLLMKVRALQGATAREAAAGSPPRTVLRAAQRLQEMGFLQMLLDGDQPGPENLRLTLSDRGRDQVLLAEALELRLVAEMSTTLTGEARVQVLSAMQSMAQRLEVLASLTTSGQAPST